MGATLSQAVSEVDFSFAVQRQDGRRYSFNRGSSTLQRSYQSASTSKLVSAVIILRLVEQGYLGLAARPQDQIANWPIGGGDSLFAMNLAQLLSFTSGLTVEPPCLNDPGSDLATCVLSIASTNAGNGKVPGSEFLYASTHMHVAGLMAVRARGDGGELAGSVRGIPVAIRTVPELELRSAVRGQSAHRRRHALHRRRLHGVPQGAQGRPAPECGLDGPAAGRSHGVPRHHRLLADIRGNRGRRGPRRGLALRLRPVARMPAARRSTASPATRVSSPGALGSYPFWERSKGYTGIVVREGVFGTLTTGITIERSVRSIMEMWAAC